jgi:hypothetical protein
MATGDSCGGGGWVEAVEVVEVVEVVVVEVVVVCIVPSIRAWWQ